MKKGFTLAEVLITLGIIGVVAALTIPTLINNYKKKQTVTQLKASYTILAQAIKMSEVENGELKYWNYSQNSRTFFEQYLKNYIKFYDTQGNNSSSLQRDITYKWLNGTDIAGNFKEEIASTYVGSTANGSFFYVYSNNGYTTTILVDINGYSQPNKVGIDLFHFSLLPDLGLVPLGLGYVNNGSPEDDPTSYFSSLDREVLTGNNVHACNKTKNGRWCTALIMADGWEIKDDYPW